MIFGVAFDGHEVEAETVAGNSGGATAGKGVKNNLTGFGISLELLHDEMNRFLRRVESSFVLRCKLPELSVLVKTRPSIFAHCHCEIFRYGQLSPNIKAACRGQIKIITAPNNLIFAHTEKLVEKLGRRRFIPTCNFVAVFGCPRAACSANGAIFFESASFVAKSTLGLIVTAFAVWWVG